MIVICSPVIQEEDGGLFHLRHLLTHSSTDCLLGTQTYIADKLTFIYTQYPPRSRVMYDVQTSQYNELLELSFFVSLDHWSQTSIYHLYRGLLHIQSYPFISYLQALLAS